VPARNEGEKAQPGIESLRRLAKALTAEGIVRLELLDSTETFSKKFISDRGIIIDEAQKGCSWKENENGLIQCKSSGCDYCATMRYHNAAGEEHLACVCWS
jgi:hypothetical protein